MPWLSFFVAFLGWFALAPLLPVIKGNVSATMSAKKGHGDPATLALAAHLEFLMCWIFSYYLSTFNPGSTAGWAKPGFNPQLV